MERSWPEIHAAFGRLLQRQLFFVGGAPRSGTTWLQQLLNSHPAVCCRGEGLFWKQFAVPIDGFLGDRRTALEAKNRDVFGHSNGYALPGRQDADVLLGTAILLALERQLEGKEFQAIGEKTPENVFFFPRLKHLFPTAKFIGISRDPRDVLTSAWHFFHKTAPSEDSVAARTAFVRNAIPQLHQGARAMLELQQQYPSDCLLLTYEGLLQLPEAMAVQLFAFLGVANNRDLAASCISRSSFAALSGRQTGDVGGDGSFFRKGVAGDWRSTITPPMNEMIVRELGWMFPLFGWDP